MPHSDPIRRWDLFWARLEPVEGSEQGGNRRPVLVLSNDPFNRAFDVVTVISLTKLEGKRRKVYPFEVSLPPASVGNGYTPIAMPQQVRTIAKSRLISRIGRLEDDSARYDVESKLLHHLGIAIDEA
ncbi:MAG TPA: type II toxin-antitoxin system PemK/MazF family toxin [Longimicrobiaceae bacterium]|nr:type II toxin-antitoxin system PemK/MazF family toxin [Longimicrobiaceae bacterium]